MAVTLRRQHGACELETDSRGHRSLARRLGVVRSWRRARRRRPPRPSTASRSRCATRRRRCAAGRSSGPAACCRGIPTYPAWRAGANSATTFTTDADLVVGTLPVPKGTYTLYAWVQNPDAWDLIINRQTGQWGLMLRPEAGSRAREDDDEQAAGPGRDAEVHDCRQGRRGRRAAARVGTPRGDRADHSKVEGLPSLNLNERAWALADDAVARADLLRLRVHTLSCGARVIDAGVDVPGGLAAGRLLAELCMGGAGPCSTSCRSPSPANRGPACRCGPTIRPSAAWRRSTPDGP